MNKAVFAAAAFVGLVLAVTLAVEAFGHRAAEARYDRELSRANRLAVEAAKARAEASQWSAELEAPTPGAVRERMEAGDTALARLGRDLEAARVRITELVQAVAEAEGGGTVAADTVVIVEDQVQSFAGRFDDGHLEALWRARVQDRSLDLDYRTTLAVELVRGVAGDGRLWVSGRALHPAARLRLDTLYVDLPEPEVVTRHSLGRRVLDGLIGAAVGIVACGTGLVCR